MVSPITTHSATLDPQQPFDVAVVMPTLLRPSLRKAVESVYRQDLQGRIQMLIGIDTPEGDPAILDALEAERPDNVALTILDPGYSTSGKHGGLSPAYDGGNLRTVLSYLANSRLIAYLDDDNWWEPDHLRRLIAAVEGKAWAWSQRWYTEAETGKDLAVDIWESIGLGKGVFKTRFGGWVDPNCLIIDVTRAGNSRWLWAVPLIQDGTGNSQDRHVFALLSKYFPEPGETGAVTVHYAINKNDPIHATRMALIEGRATIDGQDAPTEPRQ